MRGVTLIELVVTIALLAILAAVASVYIAPALDAYFASQRRAGLADVSDSAMRRMMRDVRLALPNSARVATPPGGDHFLEILLTRTGGRYRSVNDDNPATTENPLAFDGNDDGIFDAYETAAALADLPAGQVPQAGDYVVIHNLGITGANAYDGIAAASPNIGRISVFDFGGGGGGLPDENRITLNPATQFALESPGRRFFVISGPVTYACVGAGLSGGNGTGTLLRWSGYPLQAAQPTAAPGGTSAVLAGNISACEMRYTNTLHLEARGLVAVRLAITRSDETVPLYFEAHINNVP